MIHAKTLVFSLLGLGLGVALGLDGCTTSSSSICKTVCDELWLCGMIPGPLGVDDLPSRGAVEDCQARCEISASRDDLRRCVSPNAGSDRDLWCEHGRCAEFASCLRTSLENPYLLGVGTVRLSGSTVDPEPDDPAEPSTMTTGVSSTCGMSTSGGDTGTDTTGTSLPNPLTSDCPATQVTNEDQEFLGEVCRPETTLLFHDFTDTNTPYEIVPDRIVLDLVSDQLDAITVLDDDCEALQQRIEVPNVPVGTYRTQLKVFSERSNNCVLFEGALFKVTTQDVHMMDGVNVLGTRASYWIDTTGLCTEDEEVGTDLGCDGCNALRDAAMTTDDDMREAKLLDLIGVTELPEPELCPEAEYTRCIDGVDNDDDGLIDCDDQDCALSGACDAGQITGSNASATGTASTSGGTAGSSGGTSGSSGGSSSSTGM